MVGGTVASVVGVVVGSGLIRTTWRGFVMYWEVVMKSREITALLKVLYLTL